MKKRMGLFKEKKKHFDPLIFKSHIFLILNLFWMMKMSFEALQNVFEVQSQ
jgi:hypothetical protein